jgi:sulfatase maturation enzyme AslB (radical SAM superfamily)
MGIFTKAKPKKVAKKYTIKIELSEDFKTANAIFDNELREIFDCYKNQDFHITLDGPKDTITILIK